ncbi:hypothetical protein PAMP_009013 [Pampus punctatissimus]
MMPLRILGLFLLMFLLCDADSTCPAESNPLFLDPPEIIVEYNQSVIVNCTSREVNDHGMYWRCGNKSSELEEDYDFITTEIISDWNVKAQCKIIMLNDNNDNYECSKDLEITVYQNPEDVVLFPINHVRATVEGTEYDLQCDVINVAPVQNLTVRWYKDNEIIKTDSFTNTTKTPESESSLLSIITKRGDNGTRFRCEAQLDFGPHGPQCPAISSVEHTVNVQYAPEFMNKTGTDYIYVREGDNVTLNCEAEGNPPPIFHWTRGEINILEKTSNLFINQVDTNTTYNCVAINDLGSISKQIHIHVAKTVIAMTIPEASPPIVQIADFPLTLMPAEILVRFGDPISVNCSTSATDIKGMGWEATLGGTPLEENVTHVTWSVDKLEDWAIRPICYVTLPDEQYTAIPNITLYKTPDIVSVSALKDGPMMEGTEHQLKCDIINVAPANLKVKWYRGNETVFTHMINESSVTPVNVSSTWSVTPEKDYNGAHLRCKVELDLGPNGPEPIPTVTSAPYIAVVHYKPLIQGCPKHYAGLENQFSMDEVFCQSDGNPPPTLHWYNQGTLINASEPLKRTNSGEYTVEAVNSLGKSKASVDITIEYSPSFTCNDHYDVEENGAPDCKPEGIPAPYITWFKDGIKTVSPLHWTMHDSGEYLLIATNKHGKANHTLFINVLYAPVFKDRDYNVTVIMTIGENMTFACSAEGNPSPELTWTYEPAVNVFENTWGRQKSINITKATSTNIGVYSCTATNKVGSVRRFITITMKDKTSKAASSLWIIITLLICSFILIFILMIYLKCKKKDGQYNFIHDRSNEGFDIPMSTKSVYNHA